MRRGGNVVVSVVTLCSTDETLRPRLTTILFSVLVFIFFPRDTGKLYGRNAEWRRVKGGGGRKEGEMKEIIWKQNLERETHLMLFSLFGFYYLFCASSHKHFFHYPSFTLLHSSFLPSTFPMSIAQRVKNEKLIMNGYQTAPKDCNNLQSSQWTCFLHAWSLVVV